MLTPDSFNGRRRCRSRHSRYRMATERLTPNPIPVLRTPSPEQTSARSPSTSPFKRSSLRASHLLDIASTKIPPFTRSENPVLTAGRPSTSHKHRRRAVISP
ncbi:hypothetical protein HMPREF1979_03228 [Actinomyces johnsonii F0542]|uniref:Uncharacterized protein n=1 Tax=Actinomyces johnsonii F0542 TaxID=1321818 RepID=U1RRG4_9ACTO|nr:hypothetical protein HMPREF1979_03228 [Actinomyces johnsonii F0542]